MNSPAVRQTPGPARVLFTRCGVFALLSAVSCSEPASPPQPTGPERVALGVRTEGAFTGDDTAVTYTIAPLGRVGVRFGFSGSDTAYAFVVEDSATGDVVLTLQAVGGTASAVAAAPLAGPRVYLVRVLRHKGGGGTFWWSTVPDGSLPEWVAADVAVGDTVVERIDSPTDVDALALQAAAGDEFIIHFQPAGIAPDTGSPPGITLRVRGPGPDTVTRLERTAGVNLRDLEAYGAEPLMLPVAGTYRIEVSVHPLGSFPRDAAFRLAVFRLQRAPEGRAAAVALGDTVAGRLEYNGDVDEYQLAATAGDEFNMFLQTNFADPGSGTFIDLLTPSGGRLDLAEGVAGGDFLRAATSGVVRLSETGTWTIRVSPRSIYGGTLHRGDYRFYLYRIRRAPELVSASVSLGDTIAGETSDDLGDIDEFLLFVPAARTANFVAIRAGPGGGMRVQVAPLGESTPWIDFTTSGDADTAAGGSGRRDLPAGTYVLRLIADGSANGFAGPWGVQTFDINTAPEHGPAARAVGDTVSGESLDVPGDVDLYQYSSQAGAFVELFSQTLQPSAYTMNVSAWDEVVPLAILYTLNGQPLSATRSGRFRLPSSGLLTINVNHRATEPHTPGAYRIALVPYPTVPESHSVAIAVGDSVSGESLDVPGDVDEFVLSTTPGGVLQVLFWSQAHGTARIEVLAHDAVLGYGSSGLGFNATGRVVVPADGEIHVRVFEEAGQVVPTTYATTGAYTFRAVVIDPAPESLPVTLALGDTVGESIAPVGDLDEFDVALQAGDSVRVTLEQVSAFGSLYGPYAELYAPGSDAVLAETATAYVGFPASGASPPVRAPVTGFYRLRVHDPDQRAGTGPYRVSVVKLN